MIDKENKIKLNKSLNILFTELRNQQISIGNTPNEIKKCLADCQSIVNTFQDNAERELANQQIVSQLGEIGYVFFENTAQSKKELLLLEPINGSSLLEDYKSVFDKLDTITIAASNNVDYLNAKKKFNNLANELKPKGGCYIATMAYSDYDHPQVIELRKFRDEFLNKSYLGKKFIQYYYAYSPSLVEKLKDNQKVNQIVRKCLNLFIKLIKK